MKSGENVAPHQYVVIGWNKDDLTDEEFWLFVRTIKELGWLEECRSHVRDRGKRTQLRHCQAAPSRGCGVGSVEPVCLKPLKVVNPPPRDECRL